MADDAKGKYAAEIWELFRLFSRIGKTLYGFFLLLLGWGLVLKAGREVLTSKDMVQGILLPSVASWKPLQIAWFHPSLSLVGILGGALLLIWWLAYSRLIVYVWSFVRQIVRPIAICVICLLPFVMAIINFVGYPLAWLICLRVRKFRLDTFEIQWMKEHKDEFNTKKQRKEAWKAYVKIMEQKHGKKGFNSILANDSWEASNFMLVEAVTRATLWFLRRTLSRIRVGLAPVMAQSYTEEYNAATLPMRVFAQAITRARFELSELSLLKQIEIIELPPSATMQTWSQAVLFSRFFDIDVLLWGTFKEGAASSISINFLSKIRKQEKDEVDEFGSEYHRRFFPWKIDIRVPALTFDQNDAEEVYIVLLIAQILALQFADKRWDMGLRRFFEDLRMLDRVSVNSHTTIQEMLLRVIPNGLCRLGKNPIQETTPVSGRSAFVDLAGQWIGSILNVDIGSSFEKIARRKGAPSTIVVLREMAEACVMLKPDDPIGHYRLGTLHILAGASDSAIGSFKYAGGLEKKSFLIHEIGAQVAADLSSYALSKDEDVALAVWAAHAACAINTGSERAIREIWKMVDEDLPKKLMYTLLEKPEPIAITAIKRMLVDTGVERRV